jgi:hypothetical protein
MLSELYFNSNLKFKRDSRSFLAEPTLTLYPPDHPTRRLPQALSTRLIRQKHFSNMPRSGSTRRASYCYPHVDGVDFDGDAYRKKPVIKAYIRSYIRQHCRLQIPEEFTGPFFAKLMYVLRRRPLTIYSFLF